MIDREAGLLQSAHDEVRDRGIVLDEQRAHQLNDSEVRDDQRLVRLRGSWDQAISGHAQGLAGVWL